jgi:hypothetical protein
MYYVYALFDPSSNKPFYIGKGKDSRVLTHEKFRSGCKNTLKDSKIREILLHNDHVPYQILKNGFDSELDAYIYEEKIIEQIGLENLTNVCESRRPPSQSGRKRSDATKNKIKLNSKKQGITRTIEYVKHNASILFEILSKINCGERREAVCKDLDITIDLFNKIKKKYNFYVDLLNEHTDYKIEKVLIKKINGMKQRVFVDQKNLLIKMFNLIDQGVSRQEISKILGISLEFYDRHKNSRTDFFKYYQT